VNREISPPGPDAEQRAQLQLTDLLVHLLWHQRAPDCWVETNADSSPSCARFGSSRASPVRAAPATLLPARSSGSTPRSRSRSRASPRRERATCCCSYAPKSAAALVAGGRRYSEC
jgi:hypothetical protein